ncbi:MAG: type I-F CRISPR-associated endoribonuclease Cas6/Csy4 [Pontibacterium sp.]
MDFYIDLQVLPDPEFKETVLMNALCAKLHRALFDRRKGDIGISFPKAGKSLGSLLRLHGQEAALTELSQTTWLRGLRDYTESTGVHPVPAGCDHYRVERVQVKSSAERLRRRSVKKGWLSEEEARECIVDSSEKKSNLPFLQLKSQSNGQMFRLFIRHSAVVSQPLDGEFSHYGLSKNATVPRF